MESKETTLERETYTAEDIAILLAVGKNTAYALIRSGVFHSVKIGGRYRVAKKCFDEWLEGGGKIGQ